MKCIIICSSEEILWTEKYFPGVSAYMLKILNKPFIEYYIDLCSLLGVTEIRVVSDFSSPEVAEYLADGSQWGVKISFALSKSNDSLFEIIKKNSGFVGDSDLLVINKYVFINYDKNNSIYSFSSYPCNVSFADCNGLYYLAKIDYSAQTLSFEKYAESSISIRPLQSVSDFYLISMDLLKDGSTRYIIPGYNSQDNVFIGQNVEITKMTKITPPVSIGNNVMLKDAVIGPMSVIGSNVLIDSKTRISDSIICDNTYIGSDLEIEKKIIVRKKIIDPVTAISLDVPDEFIISKLENQNFASLFGNCLMWLIGVAMWIVQTPFYFCLRISPGIKSVKRSVCFRRNTSLVDILDFPVKIAPGFLNSIFFKLSLHKYPLLSKVLSGKLYLAGNSPIIKGDIEQESLLDDMSDYRPAVFTISEMLGQESVDSFAKNINELYYSNNRSFSLDFKILMRTLIQNLFR